MIMIKFAKVRKIKGCRVMLALTGYDGEAVIEAILLQPCGVGGPKAWLPPSVGDVVAVLYDAERPENSVVLGAVYPDGKNPPKTGADEIALQAGNVFIGGDVGQTKPCPRDDHVQKELKAIKSELDAFYTIYNTHTHECAAPGVASAAPASTHTNGYSVGSTASDSVEVK